MKEYHQTDIRNIALVGHASSGKTMLSEAMFYTAGGTNRLGTIAEGTTHSDYRRKEIERQHSISAAVLQMEFEGVKINLIDTPGYADFVGEALSGLRVADVGLLVVNGLHGPEMGTEVMWDFSAGHDIPRAFFINQLDKEHCDFKKSFQQLRDQFGNHVTALQIPVEEGIGFHKLVDVLRRKLLVFDTQKGTYTEEEVPANLADEVEHWYTELQEQVAESDETLMEKYFEDGELSAEDLRTGLRTAIARKDIFPVFAGAAPVLVGVRRLMEIIAKYFPSPADMPGLTDSEGNPIPTGEDAPTVAFVFKTTSEAHVGELSFFRTYAGKVSSGMDLVNKGRNITERIGHVYSVSGHDRNEIHAINAGDIGATVKLKDTHTGDTLSDPKNPVILKPIEFPPPNIQAAIVSKVKGEEDKITTGLNLIHEEDPTFFYEVDPDLHQTIISGQGELQLLIAFERLKERFKVDVEMVEPKIPYRETIQTKGDSKFRHKKQTGGAGQFAEVWMTVEPLPRGSGLQFEQTLVGQNVDRVFVPSVEKGVQAAAKEGVLAGYPIVDVKAVFYDGKQHPVDSKDIAFQIAGRGAFLEACKAAKPCLLEPIYEVEIKVPEEFMGDVMGDLTARRGRIEGMEAQGRFQIIRAKVPQANLYKYSSALRSLTQGRASHRQKFSHYEQMPHDEEAKVIAAAQAEKEKD